MSDATLKVVHTTRFDYAKPVRQSFNEARMSPLVESGQEVLEHGLKITPLTWQSTYVDYWGTRVVSFEAMRPHDALELVATSVVRLSREIATAGEQSWDEVRSGDFAQTHVEYLENPDVTAPPAELAEQAAGYASSMSVVDTAHAIFGAVRDALTYQPGSTEVHTSAQQAWAEGRGVCQDYAQLCIGALRSVGIPAQYISGYLHPRSDAAVGETVSGQSHAWVRFWADGWVGWDPTNDVGIGNDYVVVGRGRNYGDVRPTSGLVTAGSGGAISVNVEVTRLA